MRVVMSRGLLRPRSKTTLPIHSIGGPSGILLELKWETHAKGKGGGHPDPKSMRTLAKVSREWTKRIREIETYDNNVSLIPGAKAKGVDQIARPIPS